MQAGQTWNNLDWLEKQSFFSPFSNDVFVVVISLLLVTGSKLILPFVAFFATKKLKFCDQKCKAETLRVSHLIKIGISPTLLNVDLQILYSDGEMEYNLEALTLTTHKVIFCCHCFRHWFNSPTTKNIIIVSRLHVAPLLASITILEFSKPQH